MHPVTTFNDKQILAVEYPPKPLLILAGAGTGKTTTIVGRITHFIQKQNASPESILALTFTNDAADHLKRKLIENIGASGESIHACTFHSFAQAQTNTYFKEIGYSEPPTIMNRGDIYFLLRERFDELKQLRSKLFRRNPVKAVQCFQKVFEAFRQNLLSNSELMEFQKQEIEKVNTISDEQELEKIYQLADMVDVYPHYQTWKREENWIDYGDMIINFWKLIEKNKNILTEMQSQYKHVIVDEFQDNNYALSRIIEKIAQPENSITVVGDDDQCIYAFRQANIQNIHQFKERYFGNRQIPISLMKNYRSNQTILNVANWVIAENPGRMSKGKLQSDLVDEKKPVLNIGNIDEQFMKLTNDITKLLKKGEFAGNITVLLRTHTKCRQVSRFLHNNGIHTYYHAEKLYDQTVIKDLISMLHIWAKTEKADHGFLRLLMKEISHKHIADLTNKYSRDKTKSSFINYALSKHNSISDQAKAIVKPIMDIKGNDAAELVRNLIKAGKLYRQNDEIDSLKKKLAWQSLNQFSKIVLKFCKNYHSVDLLTFIKFIDVQWEVNDEPLEPILEFSKLPAVRVMTVHSAKGMEFKHVFIPFLRSGSFPLNFRSMSLVDRLPVSWQHWDVGGRLEKELHYEEERRLFYVAVTRAMESLTLFAPEKGQSPFIKTISSKLVKKEDIMIKENNLTKYDKLTGNYQSQLQSEINLEHFNTASYLLEAIQNISLLKKGKDPDWKNNPFKDVTKEYLAEKDMIEVNSNPNLSATSFQTYNECPLKYKYRFIDKIPGKQEKPYFQLGKVIHKVLEVFHEEDYRTLEDLITLLDRYWQEGGYQYEQEKEQNRQDAESMLKNYWEYIKINPVGKLYTEYWFSFKTDYATLSGKCDRIDLDENGNLSIVDYKTSKLAKTERELKKDIQLGIYALFMLLNGLDTAENENIKKIPDKLSMLFLRKDEPEVAVEFTHSDLDNFEERLRDTCDGIRRGEFSASKGKYCEWCDYRDLLCPEFG